MFTLQATLSPSWSSSHRAMILVDPLMARSLAGNPAHTTHSVIQTNSLSDTDKLSDTDTCSVIQTNSLNDTDTHSVIQSNSVIDTHLVIQTLSDIDKLTQ